MVEVGIPLWHGRDTLPDALNSLLAQTKEHFIVCISIDGDTDDYSDIIKEYQRRGLSIRVINSPINGGPGAARQRIIDTTQCDYLMFLDSDDMLIPHAVKSLYDIARYCNYDIVRSGFIREEKNKNDILLSSDIPTITWTHGKIYKVSYLKNNNIRFLDDLRTDEDAYFNLVAWNCTLNRGQTNDYTYLWRDYKNSITRSLGESGYFKKGYSEYIRSQVCGLNKIYEVTKTINHSLFTQTFINIYTYYMRAKCYDLDLTLADKHLSTIKNSPWIEEYLNNGQNWIDFSKDLTCGAYYEEDDTVYFYKEPINIWITRLLRNDNK